MKSPTFKIILFCLLFSGFSPSVFAQTPEEKIDQLFAQWDKPDSPGATVAVAQNGKIIFSKGYGSANLEYGIPNTPTTVFHVASVSKQFTVFSILLLQKDGKLSLEDDIRKYIPEVPDFGKTITLRHLASHTSGMRDQWNLLAMAGWRMDDVITKSHILKLVERQKELNFEPGEQYNYCNTGFTLLAEVVARISGKSFAEFTAERIFKPLKMTNTLFYDDHEKIVKNRAYSYSSHTGELKKSVLNFANVGATSLFTTVEDLMRWTMNFKELKVGTKAIINEMNTPHVLNNGDTFGGALGQFVTPYKGLNQIQHGGSDAGYRSYLTRFPDQDFAVAVFSNLGEFNPNRLALQVADIYLEKYMEAPMVSTPNNPKSKERKQLKLSQKQLKNFEGNYWNEAGSYSRKIYLKNDTLMYHRSGGNESPLAPISKNKFQMLNVEVDLIVKFEPTQMIVTINGEEPIYSEKYVPLAITKEMLKEYTGTFYSEELGTSYTFDANNEGLIAKHLRAVDFNLMSVHNDLFSTNSWYFQNVKFVRGEDGKITGILVSSGRVQNLWFEKL
ncbi:MAG: serine hydrolase [Saprospiraceae bacterium]|jgi:CubicO group peptidase (beta-lactamase class C family)|nr:serine hydrolase [Saprospiraceae bacterium]